LSILDGIKEKLSKQLFEIAGVIFIAIYEDGIVNDDANSIGTFLIRGRFFNETILPMILTLYNIDNKSSLSRIMVDWNYSDSFIITFGIDILEGDSDTIFGQFDRNDNVYLKVKYSF